MNDLFLEYKKRPGRARLAQLLERHQDAVYSLCYRVLRHPQDAEDACQEVLLEVSRQVDAIDQPAGFAGWLYRTTLHTALEVKRQRGRRKVREAVAGRADRTEPDGDDPFRIQDSGFWILDSGFRIQISTSTSVQTNVTPPVAKLGTSLIAASPSGEARIFSIASRLSANRSAK